jgi:mannose-6-phosphate isomerase
MANRGVKPSVQKVKPDTKDRTWGSEIIFGNAANYLGKVLVMKAGTKGGLQFHVEKEETFYLLDGIALVRYDTGDGRLTATVMRQGECYHVPPGAVHQVEAVTNCVLVEASTRHFEDRVRVEADYGLDETDGLPTTRIIVPNAQFQ